MDLVFVVPAGSDEAEDEVEVEVEDQDQDQDQDQVHVHVHVHVHDLAVAGQRSACSTGCSSRENSPSRRGTP